MSLIAGGDPTGKKVFIQHKHDPDIDLYLVRILDALTILVNTAINDKTVNVETTGVTPVVGNMVCFKEGVAFYQGKILTVTPIAGNQYTLTLDSQLDFAFTTAGGCSLVDNNLAVNGSVTPVTFGVSPVGLTAGTQWDITRMFVHIQGSATMDDGTFGDIAALTKGVLFRTDNGVVKNLLNAKSNGDFAEHAFDRSYADKAPAGKTAIIVRRTWAGQEKSGVALRLSANTADAFQGITQDNLSGLEHIHVVVQGHQVAN